ncbi:MAG: hypothetical protein II839_09110 [Kiritimatiellae bacterium]|nr:hypothetical protein [Kiritimatiellia bacterium]
MTERTAQSNQDSSLVARHSSLGLGEARALVASPLWPRIRAFLWDFASLCDPARLTGSLVTRHSSLVTAKGLLGSPRTTRAAEKALGLSSFFHGFPAEDSSRLLLLSREDYDRLAQFLGVVALAPALRRVALGAEVRALKAALSGVYPEALSYAAYFGKFATLFKQFAPADGAANPATVQSTGHSILAAALSGSPSELLLRQRLRFPEGSPADQAFGADDSSLVTRHSSLAGEARAAALLALKLFNPSEYRTLCS